MRESTSQISALQCVPRGVLGDVLGRDGLLAGPLRGEVCSVGVAALPLAVPSAATVDAEETRFSCASIRAWRRQMRWAAEKSTDT